MLFGFIRRFPLAKIALLNKIIALVGLLNVAGFALAEPEYTALFNQHDLTGWYAFQPSSGKHDNAREVFAVDQQLLRLSGSEAGYLMSEQVFDNFQLSVVYRWNTDPAFVRKNDKKNSGVMYLVPTEQPDHLWPRGIQFQIKEGATGDFVLLDELTLVVADKRTEPGKSVVVPRCQDAELPIGQWNTLVIKVLNGEVSQQLNGILVNQGAAPSVQSGRILLQYEGFPIDFKQVNIKQLGLSDFR